MYGMNKLHDDNKLAGKRKSQIDRTQPIATYGHSVNRIVHLNVKDAANWRWQRCGSRSNKLVNHCCLTALKLIVILWRYAFNK